MVSVPRTVLGVSRLGVGSLALLAPGLTGRVFGRDALGGDPWVTRLFGSRELVLAVVLLTAPEPDVRRVAALGAVIDGLDVLSSVTELRTDSSTWTRVVGGGGAVLFVALGLLAARGQRPG